ncbi:carbohydrate ABC transporter permease [Paratractidigestivibacter sp.]|uniref:carbohydrate ABC transporter permease n=1 Tax=Paratractidigestivibacter sp. TaxID=2847316 RepID=UPI003A8EFD13
MVKEIKRWWPLFVLPTALSFLFGFVIPFAQGLYLSFCEFITVGNAKFVGLRNYVDALADTQFTASFFFTVAFTVVSVVLINVIALAIAQALTRKGLKGTNAFRTVFFMPNLIGGIVLGYIWQILINCLLANAGRQLLALDSTAGFWGFIILTLWQQIGYMMIIYVAGLQSIPSDYLEAAKVDGTTAWQTFWKVKIPNLMPTITICLFLSLTNGFKLFDQNLALTGGEPAHSTEMLALNIFNTFYSRSGIKWMGIGQAKAVIFCILVVVIALVQLRATQSKEVEQ